MKHCLGCLFKMKRQTFPLFKTQQQHPRKPQDCNSSPRVQSSERPSGLCPNKLWGGLGQLSVAGLGMSPGLIFSFPERKPKGMGHIPKSNLKRTPKVTMDHFVTVLSRGPVFGNVFGPSTELRLKDVQKPVET